MNAVDAALAHELSKKVHGVGVPEQQRRLPPAHFARKACQRRFIHRQCVQVQAAVQQRIAQPAAPAELAIFGIAPNLGRRFAQSPAAPLVGPQRAGALELHAGVIEPHLQRHAGGTRSLLQVQALLAIRLGEQVRLALTNISLRQKRDALKVGYRLDRAGMEALLIKRSTVVRHGVISMLKHLLHAEPLPFANALGRLKLRALLRSIDRQIRAAFPRRPGWSDDVSSEVALPIHSGQILCNAGKAKNRLPSSAGGAAVEFWGKSFTALNAITRKPMYQSQLKRSRLCPNMPSKSMRNTAVASAEVR